MAQHTVALLVAVALATLHFVAAHYNLIEPKPYNPIDCNRPGCEGPCPPIWKAGHARARNSPSHPARVWRRGQRVPIAWHRNNHEGGFYRRSLVPVKYMYEKDWHKKTAFEFGCWTQNRFYCEKHRECGTDKKGFAYRNTMTVPKVFPDGDYVFAMVWYGGLHWRRKKGFFSDYYTCSFVRIQGGAPLQWRYEPKFVPGRNHRNDVPKGKCASTSSFVGECGGEECDNPVTFDVPGEFRGRRPKPVFLRDLNGEAGDDRKVKIAPMSEERKAIAENRHEAREDEKMVREEEEAKNERRELTNRKGGMNKRGNTGNNGWKGKNNVSDQNKNQWEKKNDKSQWKKKKNDNNPWKNTNDNPWQKTNDNNPWQKKNDNNPWQKTNNNNPWQKKNDNNPWRKTNDNNPWQKTNDNNPWRKTNDNNPWKKANGNNPWKKADDNNPWKNTKKTMTKPGCENPPPAPVGPWGPRNSQKWWQKRAEWWKRRNYCQRCGC